MLPLFFSGLLSYLVGMKRRTSRGVECKRDNSHFLHYELISLDFWGLPLGDHFWKLYVTFILQWIAFIFGKEKEEDQWACCMHERQLSFSSLCTYLPWSQNHAQAITSMLFEIMWYLIGIYQVKSAACKKANSCFVIFSSYLPWTNF